LKFARHILEGFAILLWLGAFLCYLAYGLQASVLEEPPGDMLYLGIVITLTIILTGLFSYYQERKSDQV